MKLKKHLIFLVFALLPVFAFTQNGAKTWTLRECIDHALEKNFSVKLSELNVKSAKSSLNRSKAALFPDLNGSASHNYNFGRSIDPFTNSFTTNAVQSNNFSLGANVILFNGLSNYNSIKRDKLNWQASKYDLETAKNDLTIDVAAAYTNVLFNKELLESTQLQQQISEEQLIRTEKLVRAGALPKSDELNLKARKAADEAAVITAENNLALSLLTLKQLLQLPASEPFDIEIPDINIFDQMLTREMSTADEIYTVSESTRADIKGADVSVLAAQKGVAAAKGGGYPVLSMWGQLSSLYSNAAVRKNGQTVVAANTVGYTDAGLNNPFNLFNEFSLFENTPFGVQVSDNFTQGFGLRLSVPIFNNLRTTDAVQQAKISQLRAEYESENVRLRLRQTIEQATTDVKAAKKSYFAAEISSEAAEESFRVMQKRFEAGAANSAELTQSQNEFNRADSDLIRAKYDYIYKSKVLDFYLNIPLAFD